MDLNVKTINNTNAHFSTALQTIGTERITEYQGSGSPTRYTAGTPGVYVFNDESEHLRTPEGRFESWSAYRYTRTIREDRVTGSDPAKMLSGGGMRIASDTLTNDKSQIVAGGALSGTIGSLNNTEVPGQHIVSDAGSVTHYWRNHRRGGDDTGSSTSGYTPPDVIQSISLTPTVYQQNTAPNGSGTQMASLSNSVGTQDDWPKRQRQCHAAQQQPLPHPPRPQPPCAGRDGSPLCQCADLAQFGLPAAGARLRPGDDPETSRRRVLRAASDS